MSFMTGTIPTLQTTDFAEIDRAITRLHNRRADWQQTSISQRLAYLQDCLDRTLAVAADWTNAACQAKGIDPTAALAGEEWVAGPISVVRNLRLLMNSLQAGGQLAPPQVWQREDGQFVAEVLPANAIERLLYLGYRAEVWMEPGAAPSQGKIYREPTAAKVALVLGAGNVSSIVAMDVLSKLFSENQLAIVKMNPVNAYIGAYLALAFAPLIRDGWMEIVYGGVEVGKYLCEHPQIETIHITGLHKTHDAIV
jgi:acyl-CoA reductase-like NAD-dependent aldehyde dehydrogenase